MSMQNGSAPAKLARKSLTDQAHDALRAGLAAGHYAPGAPMVLQTLADGLGISVTPVREALQRLVAERLLEILPNRSITVPQMTRAKMAELQAVRVALEGLATAEAAVRITPDALARLRGLSAGMDTAITTGDAAAYLDLNAEFHHRLYAASENAELSRLIDDLWLKVGPVFARLFETADYPPQANDQHRAILVALEAKDGPAARAAILADITSAAPGLFALLPE